MIQSSNLHIAAQTANKYLNVNNTTFMRIIPVIDKGIIKYEAVPSENIIILRNDENPFEFDALLHKIILDSQNKYYLYWDKEIFGIVNDSLFSKL